jgi:hypothetical protein
MRTLAIILLTILAPSAALAVTWDVPGDAATIQAGIDSASAGDTVLVACGTYYEHDIVLKSGVCVRGETGEMDCVIIDAQQQGRVFYGFGLDSTTRVEGLIITHGAEEDGGGMYLDDSFPIIERCSFVDNEATGWGFTGNGGGLFCYYCSPEIRTCSFYANVAGMFGGAIDCVSASPTISHCTLAYNEESDGGGAIACWGSSAPTLDHTIIAYEVNGAAIYCHLSAVVTLTCCDLYGNERGDWVGCIENQLGVDGNISADPLFCDPKIGDLTLSEDSPCNPDAFQKGCGLIGAWPVACGGHTAVAEQRPTSWSAVKAMYR